jgi:hypothetical protein
MTETETDLAPVDRVALECCLEIAMKEDTVTRRQLQVMLTDRPWTEVATFASYCCQSHALNLKPWEYPPCWADDDEANPDGRSPMCKTKEARALLLRMLAAGISRYDPDPMAALAKGKRK